MWRCMDVSDAQIIAQSQSSPERFADLVRRHHGAIFGYAARRVGVTDAEDVASETFAIAFSRRAIYDNAYPSAAPWLYGIANNLIRGHRRTERRALLAYSRTGTDPLRPTTTQQTDRGIDAAVAGAVAAMKPNHRDALLLYALAELSYDEVGLAMGVPVGTVKGWIARARTTATRELAARGIPHAASIEPGKEVSAP